MSDVMLEKARFNMIEQQIRPAEVLDQRVLDALAAVPREEFVPARFRKLAFSDTTIPIGHGQDTLRPIFEARLLQALNVRPSDRILEVGTGCGYLTAVLAHLGDHVYSVEINPEILAMAAENLRRRNITNVTLELGDAAQGWGKHAPYDVIACGGAFCTLPDAYRQSLAVGGRLFAVVGCAPVMQALLITRISDNDWSQDVLFETELPSLKNAEAPQTFVF